jgi:hypothetical protein
VIAGILRHAGIAGFLGNLTEFYAVANTESAGWRSLVAVWWEKYKGTPMTTAELWPLAREFEELEIRGKDEGGQRRSFLRCASPEKPQRLQYLLYAWGERSRPCREPWKLPHGGAIDDFRPVEDDKHSGEPKRKMRREATATSVP